MTLESCQNDAGITLTVKTFGSDSEFLGTVRVLRGDAPINVAYKLWATFGDDYSPDQKSLWLNSARVLKSSSACVAAGAADAAPYGRGMRMAGLDQLQRWKQRVREGWEERSAGSVPGLRCS